MTTLSRRLGVMMILTLLAGLAQAATQPISRVFAFGDSLSDVGNLYDLTAGARPPSPDYFDGRFSNGALWVELMSVDLGVELSNYAVGGAKTGSGNVEGPYPGLQTQISQFVADLGGAAADPLGLFTVFAGSNNLGDFIPGVTDPGAFVTQGVTEILNAVGTLRAVGAQRVMVFGLPDLGLTPRARALPGGVAAQLSALSDAWNGALFANLPAVGVPAYRTVDTAGALRDMVANPAAYGLTNVTDACLFVGCNTEQQVPRTLDPDEFLFWDDIHPTRVAHAVFADLGYETALVPVPPALLLFAPAVALLGCMMRRSRA
ncbi:MAG: SGNH/GDSL hydrolase family protein [Gammaproteobacteria bacterium]